MFARDLKAARIPGDMTSLLDGLQEQDRPIEPSGLMQGTTGRRCVGYFGPRPPVGDPPHRCHFRVLAHDRLLQLPLGATG